MLTKIDQSATGILVVCLACPHWFAFALTMGNAHDRACNHEELVHPGAKLASNRRHIWLRRHAARSSDVGNASDPRGHGTSRAAERSDAPAR